MELRVENIENIPFE
jgi:hypothetical protein